MPAAFVRVRVLVRKRMCVVPVLVGSVPSAFVRRYARKKGFPELRASPRPPIDLATAGVPKKLLGLIKRV